MKTKKALKITGIVLLISFIFIILGSIAAFFVITADAKLDVGKLYNGQSSSKIYSSDSEELKYTSAGVSYVPYSEISEVVFDAFIALEDKRFYKHHGVDLKRIMGAAYNNIKAGYLKEGASTITQQLAKNALLSNEKTYERKLKEIRLAFQIEKQFTKNEILEMYLNEIYFGNGIYGISEASRRIFGKTPNNLNLAEAAMLAGIVKNPRDNSPLSYPENAYKRMKVVLTVMKREGYIDDADEAEALKYSYVNPELGKSRNSAYISAVIEEAANKLGITEKELVAGGYKIYTFCDAALQKSADKLIEDANFDADGADKCILIADNTTGGIKTFAANFSGSIFNMKRQPGSVIKPVFSYAGGFETGYIAPATPVMDEKREFNDYFPGNYGEKYLGKINIREALISSSNVVAVALADELGVDYCKSVAQKTGLFFNESDGLSASLGGLTDGVTLTALTESYATLANGGLHTAISFIKSIADSEGKTVYRNGSVKTRALSEETSYIITDILMDTARRGTAKKLSSLNYSIASKTGTAGTDNGNSDAINMSYTDKNTVCIWYGYSSGEKLLDKSVTGGSYPTLLAKYTHEILGAPPTFFKPYGIIETEYDWYATQKEMVINLPSDKTPEEYKKAEIFNRKYLTDYKISDYYENIVNKYSVQYEDGGIKIEFLPKTLYNYEIIRIKNGKEEILSNISTTDEVPEVIRYIDETAGFGLNTYIVKCKDENGTVIFVTDKKSAFGFNIKWRR